MDDSYSGRFYRGSVDFDSPRFILTYIIDILAITRNILSSDLLSYFPDTNGRKLFVLLLR